MKPGPRTQTYQTTDITQKYAHCIENF